MHIEARKHGDKKVCYLAHAFRHNGKARKVRRYLGLDLDESQISSLRVEAEKSIREQIAQIKAISDPLKTVLPEKEIKEIEAIVSRGEVKIEHLSYKDWRRFAELFAYDTNAIEGSTVTRTEVENILEKGLWPDKPKEEVAETYGVSESIDFVRNTKEHISIQLIKELHWIVFKNSKHFAGEFRSEGVEVAVVDGRGNVVHRGAPQRQVLPLLRELAGWYDKNKMKYHPILLAAVVHNQFENIHPFQDGNGRVGRLLLNNVLIKHGLPPVNIELKHRDEYYRTIREYEFKGDIRPAIELILKEYGELKKALKKQ